MFDYLHSDHVERLSLQIGDRKMQNMTGYDKLILYPSIEVVNLIHSKGLYSGQMRYGQIHGFGLFESATIYGLASET